MMPCVPAPPHTICYSTRPYQRPNTGASTFASFREQTMAKPLPVYDIFGQT